MNLYVASSWRNRYQPTMVRELRLAGHLVYDFRCPRPGESGFSWTEIDPDWEKWNVAQFRAGLKHATAGKGFLSDYAGMSWAQGCVLVLPCGRSAHLEAGWFAGLGRPLAIYSPIMMEPELMYRMAGLVTDSMAELLRFLEEKS